MVAVNKHFAPEADWRSAKKGTLTHGSILQQLKRRA